MVYIYENSDHVIGQFEELLVARRQLNFAADHDAMTGLLNRRGIDFALKEVAQAGEKATVFMVDLDGFKLVNDSLRHAAGDEVLKAVAKRIAHLIRPVDTIGRIGGDEFVVIVRGSLDRDYVSIVI